VLLLTWTFQKTIQESRHFFSWLSRVCCDMADSVMRLLPITVQLDAL